MTVITLKELHALADKYSVQKNGSKATIAYSLCSLRGIYLSNTERLQILPFVKNSKNKTIMKDHIKNNCRKKLPKD